MSSQKTNPFIELTFDVRGQTATAFGIAVYNKIDRELLSFKGVFDSGRTCIKDSDGYEFFQQDDLNSFTITNEILLALSQSEKKPKSVPAQYHKALGL